MKTKNNRGGVLLEYCLVNLFIGAIIVILWSVCFYNPGEGWVEASKEDADKAQLSIGGKTEPVDLKGSSGKALVGSYQRVTSGIAMPYP